MVYGTKLTKIFQEKVFFFIFVQLLDIVAASNACNA